MYEKKKIKPEDLELNIEVLGKSQQSTRVTNTYTCAVTKNNCGDATFDKPELCDTTTTNPTIPECQTIAAAGCLPTQRCMTIEPACETKAGCVDSASKAELCCPIDKTVDRDCMTNDTCGPNTLHICLVTSDCNTLNQDCQISGDDETCNCINTVEDTCNNPPVISIVTTECEVPSTDVNCNR